MQSVCRAPIKKKTIHCVPMLLYCLPIKQRFASGLALEKHRYRPPTLSRNSSRQNIVCAVPLSPCDTSLCTHTHRHRKTFLLEQLVGLFSAAHTHTLLHMLVRASLQKSCTVSAGLLAFGANHLLEEKEQNNLSR